MREAHDPQTEWAKTAIAALVDAGVRTLVLSPGSRSTPLVFAAAREERLRAIDVLDERAAAFYALSLAKLHAAPVALLCTSGTAAAHYFPAVIEARHRGLPLVVLTADRPTTLQQCGALQTTDQSHLYGRHVVGFWECGAATATAESLHAVRRMIVQAVARATAGPVQLNFRFVRPLEPALATVNERAFAELAARVRETPLTVQPAPTCSWDTALATRLVAESPRGLIVCGPASSPSLAPTLAQLAKKTGYPILAELTSQLRGESVLAPWLCDAPELVLTVRRDRPQLIIQVGEYPTSAAYDRLVGGGDIARLVIGARDWGDPVGDARLVVNELSFVAALAHALPERAANAELHSWLQTSRGVREAVAAQLTQGAFSEAQAVAALGAALPPAWQLMVGNSLSIRLADAYWPRGAQHRVWSQRGVSGIDGLIAGAAALASAAPTALLLGDVSFLHDTGALLLAARAEQPLVIVVLNNEGGRIFDALPIGDAVSADVMAHFTTPHAVDLSAIARGFGLAAERVSDVAALQRALASAIAAGKPTVIEVKVGPAAATTTASQLRARLAALS